MDIKLTIGFLSTFLACVHGVTGSVQLSPAVPSPWCQYHVISDSTFQDCVSVLGNLNTTVLTQNEKCSYYAESVYCAKRAADTRGGHCSLADIEYWYNLTISFLDHDDFKDCNVTTETSSLCSADRLPAFALTSCRPYLKQMESTQCMLIDYFLKCIHTYLGYMHVTCTDTQLQTALTSTNAGAWLQMHHSSVDLRACFNVPVTIPLPTTTIEPHTSRECVAVIDMFTNHGIIECIAYLQDVNLTGNGSIPTKDGCSLINEALVCMQRAMKGSGFLCSLQQMHDTLVNMLHVNEMLGPGVSNLVSHCTVNSTYATASVCSDSYRLATYLSNTIAAIIRAVEGYHSKSLVCTTIETTAGKSLQYVNAKCTSGELWSALKSPVGMSKLAMVAPRLDLSNCGDSWAADHVDTN